MRDWFELFLPPRPGGTPPLVLDGDLPKREWFTDERTPFLSAADGEPHTVVPGRPIGLHAHTVGELAAQGVHLHVYGDYTLGQWRDWVERARGFAGDYLHLHPNVNQSGWTRRVLTLRRRLAPLPAEREPGRPAPRQLG